MTAINRVEGRACVLRGDDIQLHRYIEHIPWQVKFSPRLRAAGADSTRFGAVSVDVESGRIYMLFGGRPFRSVHPFEPTTLIDVGLAEGRTR